MVIGKAPIGQQDKREKTNPNKNPDVNSVDNPGHTFPYFIPAGASDILQLPAGIMGQISRLLLIIIWVSLVRK